MKDVMAAEDYSEEQDDLSFSPFVKSSDNTPEHVCSLENDGGPCTPVDPTMFKTRFYHNKTTGSCEKFLYSGCGGNHNNFFNKSDCEAFCGAPTENAPERTEKTKLHKELTIFVKRFNQRNDYSSFMV
ncbi:kunitz-type serine protease inhibitor bitisilin-1 [Eurytemora carolleeae]|uniref:kunitz-type serine protease inhibitor bitisilin-1 n=1 Tax=Eurytemora carolleeae TaxID=1294199 RepID=UPI000C790487|nr:kunitz-type serine protease inhibitor bitisilin-1 [Eurytemora carolleeae]|eukprot:XP_023347625.1 kunitz-type serine protease inhibitor bitisilin-1-like [Eurytemora affinis]